MRERTRMLLRENLARLRADDVLAQLSTSLARPITLGDFGPLSEADDLRSIVRPRLASARAHTQAPHFSTWRSVTSAVLGEQLGQLLRRVHRTPLLYLPFAWDFLGVLALRGPDFDRIVEIALTAAEECTVSVEDAGAGLRLEYQANEAEHGADRPFELTIWGSTWIDAALSVLSTREA